MQTLNLKNKEHQEIIKTAMKVPNWSCLREGETYIVTDISNEWFFLRNVKTGGSTMERLRDINYFTFSIKE